MSARETYSIEIAGLKRELRLFQIKPGLRIAILNILGDTELVQACAHQLGKQLNDLSFDVLVTAEAKSIPLAYALSLEMKKPYVILRKTYKPYMGDALRAETLSITTGEPQILVLDEKDRASAKRPESPYRGRCDQHRLYASRYAYGDREGRRDCRQRSRHLNRGRALQMGTDRFSGSSPAFHRLNL